MNARKTFGLLATSAMLGGTLLVAPSAYAAGQSGGSGSGAVTAGAEAAAVKNTSCTISKKRGKKDWKTCVSKVSVRAKTSLRLENVSSGGKKVHFAVTNPNGSTIKRAKLAPGDGYQHMMTNNGSKAKTVKIKTAGGFKVDVIANIRYKIG